MFVPSKFADTFATLEQYDFRVASVALHPDSFNALALKAKGHLDLYDNPEPETDVVIVGEPRAKMWGCWICVSESVPLGQMLVLPPLKELCVPSCGADIREMPLLKRVAERAVHEATTPPRGRGASRMRTEEDRQGWIEEFGPHATEDQIAEFMDRKYPNG